MTNSHIDSLTRQSTGPQLVERKVKIAKNGSVSRVHTVPSTVDPKMRERIIAEVNGGRSIPQTAKEYNCVQIVVTEIWLRAELAKLRGVALRRAA